MKENEKKKSEKTSYSKTITPEMLQGLMSGNGPDEMFPDENWGIKKTLTKEELNEIHRNEIRQDIASRLIKPKEMKEYLDQYIIGQDEAKRTLCVAMYNHYKRIISGNSSIEKSNIMLCGATGSGKTFMIKTLAKKLGVPCYIGSATSITESGYVGDDVESLIVGLLRQCSYDTVLAEFGICFIDEVDKLGKRGANMSITRDVGGEGVQQALLKMVEGSVIGVPPMGGRKHPEQPLIYIDTTNILFVGSGAFVGIDDIVKKRLGRRKIGFDTGNSLTDSIANEDYFNYVSPQDLKTYGLIPEFVGRFPVITNVNPLTVEDLELILSKPKNAIIKQYKDLFSMDNVKLTIKKDALAEIAKAAYELKTGARGLRNIVETILSDYMFDIPSGDELVITKSIVLDQLNKKCRYKLMA